MTASAARAATAFANVNLAFVKYWGNLDDALRLPANGSISMNLDGLGARTSASFRRDLGVDEFMLDRQLTTGDALRRVVRYLDVVREMAGVDERASVVSTNSVPSSTGVASSAAAFAALALAATSALAMTVSERELSCLARLGSGSAARSVPGGFVEWHTGRTHATSYAETIAPAEHWDLTDVIAVVDKQPKRVGSTEGHRLANTSPLQGARVESATERLARCKSAVLNRDFELLASVAELDSNLLHAVMMTSTPALFYWRPATLELMHAVSEWRAKGFGVFYSVDAGANVHCVCLPEATSTVVSWLRGCDDVLDVLTAGVGGPARICEVGADAWHGQPDLRA